MRRKIKNRKTASADFVYNSDLVGKFINYILKNGQKDTAKKIMYSALDEIKTKLKTETPIEVLELAIKNASPLVEVRSRRIGGATYQVPSEVRPTRRLFLACNWILEGARSKKGMAMDKKLADEIIATSKGEGLAVKKKENVHRMAEANKAFAHFAW